jgi:GT2 family glycosyltransferase
MRSPRTVELAFEPVSHLEILDSAPGRATYRATGDDPQFSVHADPGLAGLRPGWWLLRGRITTLDGAIITPKFYADYGHGYNEHDSLPLTEPDIDGVFQALVVVRAPIEQLRFDPTIRTAVFRIESMVMHRMSRVGALRQMLAGIGGPGRDRQGAQARADFMWLALKSGPGRAAAMLFQRYVEAGSYAPTGYELWHRLFDPLHEEVLARTPAADLMPDGAPISLVLSVDAPRIEQLRQCVESVRGQTWPHWELHLAADESTDAAVARLLQECVHADARIHLHPSIRDAVRAATQRAAAYTGMLRQADVLARGALSELVHALAISPGCRLLYTDEDRIDGVGRRFNACFKPDWSPDLLHAHNYLGPFLLVRSDLLRTSIAAVQEEGAWSSHALALRCTEALEAGQIGHVPKVLYHRRAAEAAALRNSGVAIPARADAAAVQRHLSRGGRAGSVEPLDDGRVRVRWPLPSPVPSVTIIIPTRDRLELLEACIHSVFARTEYERFDVMVVDNDSVERSTLDYLADLRSRPRCSVLSHPGVFNFSALVNDAARHASGELLCLLNNDMEVISPDWLSGMASHAVREGVGAVGAMLYYPDDTVQHGGVILGIGGVAGHIYHRSPRGGSGYHGRALVTQPLSAVTGACMVVCKASFEEVGGFDEGLAIAFNDIDFCLRLLEKGYRNVWTPHAELYHHESASRGSEDTLEKRARFSREVTIMRNRWGEFLDNDPAYNPNLTLDGSHFELSFPPRLHPLHTYLPQTVPHSRKDPI